MLHKKTVQLFWLACGWFSFILGFIGIFLPLLPTTPFMLFAAFCFDKGSPKLHTWLLNLPKIGPPIRDWKERKVISNQAKMIAVTTIIIGITMMWIKAPDKIISIKIIVGMIMISVIFFILRQKSK